MSYLPAFHLVDGAFVRCRDCAAIIYDSDTATHDAWHDEVRDRDRQLRQMYLHMLDQIITPETRERLTEPYQPTPEQLAEAREWRKANFPGISDE